MRSGGRIRDTDLEEVRRRANLIDVASEYMQVKRAGRLYKALCPFHAEKTPSLSLDPAKNLWHCLAGETGVITFSGVVPIAKLAGGTHRLLTSRGAWVDAEVKSFGIQKLWALNLSRNGVKKTLYATDGHRWFIRTRRGINVERTTLDLKPNDPLSWVFPQSSNLRHTGPSPFGIAHGFTFGDGTRTSHGCVAGFDGNKDEEMLRFFPEARVWRKGRIRVGRLPLFFKDFPPLNEAPAYLYGWLAGLFAADGCVATDGQVILSSASAETLEFVRTIANRVGIGTYRIKHQRRLGLGSVESDLYHLTFINSTLDPTFFALSKHRDRFVEAQTKVRTERRGWRVESIKETDRVEEVYCAIVPETHAFALEDNILTGNCFGCGEGGDTIRLVEKLENLTFLEAIERLARLTGVELHYEQLSEADRAAQRRRGRLVDAHREAANYFHEILKHAPEASDARGYLLKQRGFKGAILEEFKVGFSLPKWDALVGHLRKQGFGDQEISEAGLGARRQDGGLVDRFRGRVMFPIEDLTGNPVGFGARRMSNEDGPKYLNSPESPIYKKAHLLYALGRAKGEIVNAGYALIVEGYTDVIALHQVGIRQAVATCGTALGLDHLRLIQRFVRRVTLSLDADEAGSGSADRTYDQLVEAAQGLGIGMKVVAMPPGDDPADFVLKNGGEVFAELVERAEPLLFFRLGRQARRYVRGDVQERSQAVAEGLRLLDLTEDEVMRREGARRFAGAVGIDEDILQHQLRTIMHMGFRPKQVGQEVLKRSSGQVRLEREALKLAIQRPRSVKAAADDVGPELFSIPAHQAIWVALRNGTEPALLAESFEDDAARQQFTKLAVEPIPVNGEPTDEALEQMAAEVFRRLKEFVISRKIEQLTPQLQRLNPLENPREHDELFARLLDLQRQKRELNEMGEGAE